MLRNWKVWTFLVFARNTHHRCSIESSIISVVHKMKGKNTHMENWGKAALRDDG